jgi:hypothetical protein
MKNHLNEELNRIKQMMGSIQEQSFEKKDGPSPEIKERVMELVTEFLNREDNRPDDWDVNNYEGSFEFGFDTEEYIKYDFDIIPEKRSTFTPGRYSMDNGDPGYPDESEPYEYSVSEFTIEYGKGGDVNPETKKWEPNIIYTGKDFTDFQSLKFSNGQRGDQWFYQMFDDKIEEPERD